MTILDLLRRVDSLNLAECDQLCELVAHERGFPDFNALTEAHLASLGLCEKQTGPGA